MLIRKKNKPFFIIKFIPIFPPSISGESFFSLYAFSGLLSFNNRLVILLEFISKGIINLKLFNK